MNNTKTFHPSLKKRKEILHEFAKTNSSWKLRMAVMYLLYFLGLGVKNKSKYKCAYPYSSYANGTLILNGQDLQYIFWQVGSTEPAAYSSHRAVFHDEDKFIYNIKREDIRDLQISDIGICSITGGGQLILPKDVELSKTELKEISNNFSFALAFDEKNISNTIMNWKNQNG